MPNQTLVISNQERLVQIQVSTGLPTRGPDGKDRPPAFPATLLNLHPGINTVDSKVWLEAKKIAVVRGWLMTKIAPSAAPEQNQEKVGRLILVEGRSFDTSSPLTDLKFGEAQEIISETLAPVLLKEWLVDEVRPDVRRALQARIEETEGR